MDKWEYLHKSGEDLDLDKLGEEGWEMCGVETTVILGMGLTHDYYFKRRKE